MSEIDDLFEKKMKTWRCKQPYFNGGQYDRKGNEEYHKRAVSLGVA